MCVTTSEEWMAMEEAGYGGPIETMTVEPPAVDVWVHPDLYAGVDWEEVHPPLTDLAAAMTLPDLALEDLDLDLGDLDELNDYLALEAGSLH